MMSLLPYIKFNTACIPTIPFLHKIYIQILMLSFMQYMCIHAPNTKRFSLVHDVDDILRDWVTFWKHQTKMAKIYVITHCVRTYIYNNTRLQPCIKRTLYYYLSIYYMCYVCDTYWILGINSIRFSNRLVSIRKSVSSTCHPTLSVFAYIIHC